MLCVSLYKEGIKLRPVRIKSSENIYEVPYSNTIYTMATLRMSKQISIFVKFIFLISRLQVIQSRGLYFFLRTRGDADLPPVCKIFGFPYNENVVSIYLIGLNGS